MGPLTVMRWIGAPFAISVLVGFSACEPPPPVYSGGVPAGGRGLSTPSGEYGVGGTVGAPSGAEAPLPDPSSDWEGYLRAKCARRDAKLCVMLARSYEFSSSVDGAFIPQDFKNAYRFYEYACEYGAPDGCFKKGMFLISGKGVDVDGDEGVRLVNEACERGSGDACATIREAERSAAAAQERRDAEARAQAARIEAARQEAALWAPVVGGSEWFCFEIVDKTNPRDRASSCDRVRADCVKLRGKVVSNNARISKCQPQLRAACFTYVLRLAGRRFQDCSANFEDCEGARIVAAGSADRADVTSECRAF